MSRKKVLITGMGGLIGGILSKRFESKYELSGLDIVEVPGRNIQIGDISNLEQIQPLFEGKDIVIHLAAFATMEDDWDNHLQFNIKGTYNVFEAARRAGVKRVIYASAGAAILGLENEFPYNAIAEGRYEEAPETWPMITHEAPVRPGGLYGCCKVWGEVLARYYTDTYNMSIICLRFGAVTRENRPIEPRHYSMWVNQSDLGQLIEKCIEAPESLRYDIFFAVSDNKWGYRDIDHARQVVGYSPEDSAENYR